MNLPDPPDPLDIIMVEHLPDGARFGKAETWIPSSVYDAALARIAELEDENARLAAGS